MMMNIYNDMTSGEIKYNIIDIIEIKQTNLVS